MAIADRDETQLAALRQSHGGSPNVLIASLDVTDEAAAQSVVASVAATLGGLDGVVNSAGIAADIPALDTPVDLFRRVLDVNVTGTFIVARAAARIMKDRGGGAIVNMASVAGLRGSKGRSAYGASKGAVAVLTQVPDLTGSWRVRLPELVHRVPRQGLLLAVFQACARLLMPGQRITC